MLTLNDDSKTIEWMRLDNAATIFALVYSKRITTVFRLSAVIDHPVKVSILQQALEHIIDRFPYYRVHLRRGLFWHYLEKNTALPKIEPEQRDPCQKIEFTQGNNFPFRVMAYKNRVSVEFSHILTDGTGALTFLKSLLAEYFTLLGVEIEDWGDIPRPDEQPDFEEYEDAFKHYYRKEIPFRPLVEKAFHLPERLDKKGSFHIITGITEVKEVLDKARSLKVSITEFLVSVYINVLQEILHSYPPKKKRRLASPIRIMVPVNLRRIYKTKTMRNFSLYVIPGIDPRLGHYTFEEILNKVHHYMRSEVDDKFINQQIARNVRGELNPFVRFTPLVIKKLFGKAIYYNMGEKLYSGVLTNLGQVKLPKELENHIESFYFLPAPSPFTKNACAIVSYKDKLVISFGRVIKSQEVERKFFTSLVRMGIKVKVESN